MPEEEGIARPGISGFGHFADTFRANAMARTFASHVGIEIAVASTPRMLLTMLLRVASMALDCVALPFSHS